MNVVRKAYTAHTFASSLECTVAHSAHRKVHCSVNTVRSASVGEPLQLTIEATASLAAVPQVSECHANEHEQRPSCEKHEWHTRVQTHLGVLAVKLS